MLINISNHPSSKWSNTQHEAANKYGTIKDQLFPVIDPEWNTDQIGQKAKNMVDDLIDAYGFDITAHVMGEMTFTHALVYHLQRKGIKCVASTTVRNVEEDENGKKTSYFRFVSFRPYICLDDEHIIE